MTKEQYQKIENYMLENVDADADALLEQDSIEEKNENLEDEKETKTDDDLLDLDFWF